MLGFSQGAAVAAALAAMCPAVVGEGEGESGESGASGARGPVGGEGGGGGGEGVGEGEGGAQSGEGGEGCIGDSSRGGGRDRGREPAEGEGGGGGGDGLAAEWPFRFAVLCSGYVSEARQIALLTAPVRLPSLHVFCTSDRQLRDAAPCAALAAAFAPEARVVVQHTQALYLLWLYLL